MTGLYPSRPTLRVRIGFNPCRAVTGWDIWDSLRKGDKRNESLDMLVSELK